jgi:hypothetical protein
VVIEALSQNKLLKCLKQQMHPTMPAFIHMYPIAEFKTPKGILAEGGWTCQSFKNLWINLNYKMSSSVLDKTILSESMYHLK